MIILAKVISPLNTQSLTPRYDLSYNHPIIDPQIWFVFLSASQSLIIRCNWLYYQLITDLFISVVLWVANNWSQDMIWFVISQSLIPRYDLSSYQPITEPKIWVVLLPANSRLSIQIICNQLLCVQKWDPHILCHRGINSALPFIMSNPHKKVLNRSINERRGIHFSHKHYFERWEYWFIFHKQKSEIPHSPGN